MITDAELYELEMLFISKYKHFDFSTVTFDNVSKSVLLENNDLIALAKLFYSDRCIECEKGVIISFDIFKILKSRYFKDNVTLSFFYED